MSRGEQRLPISYDECMQGAVGALQAEGYTLIGQGGAFFHGFEDIHGAYVLCNVAPEETTWANIVVASSHHDAGVPGAERQRLQERMGRRAGPPAGPPAGDNAPFLGTWYRGGGTASVYEEGGQLFCRNEHGMVTRCRIESPTQMRALDWEGGLLATLSADRQTLDWANGTFWSR